MSGLVLSHPVNRMTRLPVVVALGGLMPIALALDVPAARATEGGGQQYAIGVDTADPAMLPPPGGSMFLNYSVGYWAGRLNDGQGNSARPGFGVNVVADAVKLVHTWGRVGGVDVASGIVNTVANTDLTVVPGHVEGNDFGLADTCLLPVMLHAEVGHGLHLGFAANVWVPDGDYSRHNPASLGFNRTSVGFQVITTWLPDDRWDLSTSTMVELGAKNQATDYYSGTYVDTDFQVGYRFFEAVPKLQLGIQGYYLQQVEDDRIAGQPAFGTGYRGMAVAVGPQIRYDAWDHGAIIMKWQHELSSENRARGDRLWVQLGVPF
ncbi:MAG: hypothetical protein F8N37_14915 [Telmatospirillum sp.]|nr:hypothetical protein [Telmatospirillum sp.]